MLHHVSIAANNPRHVAEVIAEICQGEVAPFPPHPGSYIVATLDEVGTMIEIYPQGTEMQPGLDNEEVVFVNNALASAFTPTHIAFSVPVSQEKIEAVAAREGWRAVLCNRVDCFEVIEFWIENRLLIELLPPTLAPKYISFMQPENLRQFFAEPALVG